MRKLFVKRWKKPFKADNRKGRMTIAILGQHKIANPYFIRTDDYFYYVRDGAQGPGDLGPARTGAKRETGFEVVLHNQQTLIERRLGDCICYFDSRNDNKDSNILESGFTDFNFLNIL